MTELPAEIWAKIMLYNVHPTADMMKGYKKFYYLKYRCESKHGYPFDRGSADAYYGRDFNPHYWPNGTYRGCSVEQDQMTEEEIQAYTEGYTNQKDRKFW